MTVTLNADGASPLPSDVEQVYNTLVSAIGSPKPAAQLKLVTTYRKGDKLIFYAPTPAPTIYITDELLDFCTAYGYRKTDMLACLLSHELGHHFLNHGGNEFLSIFENPTAKDKLTENGRSLEKEADAFGLIYGYVAGFNTVANYEELLTDIEKKYFPAAGNKALRERSASLSNKIIELETLVACYEAGHIFSVSKNYRLSNQCFQYIAGKFPAKEILNSMAANYLNLALEAGNENEDLYAYPVEIDETFRLKYKGLYTRGSEEPIDKKTIGQWLDSAKLLLRKVIGRNNDYSTARVNLAIAHILAENNEAALGVIKEMELSGAAQLPANAQLLRAMAYSNLGEKTKADQYFQLACQGKAFRCEYNYSLFKERSGYTASASSVMEYFSGLKKWVYEYFADESSEIEKPLFFDFDMRNLCFREKFPADVEVNSGDKTHPILIRFTRQGNCQQLTVLLKSKQLFVATLFPETPMNLESDSFPETRITSGSGREYLYFESDRTVLEIKDNRVLAISRVETIE